jgi:hypothetical protein
MAASSSTPSAAAALDPPMDNDWEFLHGRLDAAVDANLEIIESVPVEDVESYHQKRNQLEEGWSDIGEDSTSPASVSGMYWSPFNAHMIYFLVGSS